MPHCLRHQAMELLGAHHVTVPIVLVCQRLILVHARELVVNPGREAVDRVVEVAGQTQDLLLDLSTVKTRSR